MPQQDKPGRDVSQGLRSPGWFAKWPIIGVTMFLLGSLAFGALAYNVQNQGPVIQTDVTLYRELYSDAVKAPPIINEVMIFGFFFGKEIIQLLVVILSLYFLHKRFWRELAMLLIGSIGGSLIWHFFNVHFNRPRPEAQLGIVVTNPSFPSGHTASAIISYGLLAYLLIPKMPSRFWKWLVGVSLLLILAYTAFSRIFLGGHYLTDVLAGYALGLAWAGLAFTLIEKFIGKGRTHNVKKR